MRTYILVASLLMCPHISHTMFTKIKTILHVAKKAHTRVSTKSFHTHSPGRTKRIALAYAKHPFNARQPIRLASDIFYDIPMDENKDAVLYTLGTWRDTALRCLNNKTCIECLHQTGPPETLSKDNEWHPLYPETGPFSINTQMRYRLDEAIEPVACRLQHVLRPFTPFESGILIGFLAKYATQFDITNAAIYLLKRNLCTKKEIAHFLYDEKKMNQYEIDRTALLKDNI